MKRNDSKEWFRDLTRRLGKLKYPIVVFLFGLILLAIPFGNSQKQVENKQSSQAPAEIVEDTDESSLQDLENRLLSSGLFVSKTIDTGDASIVVFELVQSQRLWLLFAVFALLAEYRDYQDIFTGYFGDIGYYLDEGHQYD